MNRSAGQTNRVNPEKNHSFLIFLMLPTKILTKIIKENAIKTNTLFANFRPLGLYRAKQKTKNDNNDNLCKIHGGLYIASALMKTTNTCLFLLHYHCLFLLHYHFPMEDSSELLSKKSYKFKISAVTGI